MSWVWITKRWRVSGRALASNLEGRILASWETAVLQVYSQDLRLAFQLGGLDALPGRLKVGLWKSGNM